MGIYDTQEKRPVLSLPLSPVEIAFEALAFAGLLCFAYLLWHYWPLLPEIIPTHFGIGGQPDGWGSKRGLIIDIVVIVMLYVSLSLVTRIPHKMNYPWPITEENAAWQYRIARMVMRWLKVVLTWLMVYTDWITIRVAFGQAQRETLMFPLLAVMLSGAIVLLVIGYRHR